MSLYRSIGLNNDYPVLVVDVWMVNKVGSQLVGWLVTYTKTQDHVLLASNDAAPRFSLDGKQCDCGTHPSQLQV